MVSITEDFLKALKAKSLTAETIAPMVGLTAKTWSLRKRAKVSWELDKVFQIMDILELPVADIEKYFTGGKL